MRKYYFHIMGGFNVEDDEGYEFPDVDTAMVQARRMAHDLALDADNYLGCFVCMTDEEGNELASIPVKMV